MTKKVMKNNLRITAKPNAHLQTMAKAPAKFQKDLGKIGGVTFARCPEARPKTVEKMPKINLRITDKPHAYLQILTKHLQSFKQIQLKL